MGLLAAGHLPFRAHFHFDIETKGRSINPPNGLSHFDINHPADGVFNFVAFVVSGGVNDGCVQLPCRDVAILRRAVFPSWLARPGAQGFWRRWRVRSLTYFESLVPRR